MRIHEVEIYSSKQIYAFIEYLKVVAEEKKAIEDMQSHYQAGNLLAANSCVNQGTAVLGGQATPEYFAKVAAQREREQASQAPDAKLEVRDVTA